MKAARHTWGKETKVVTDLQYRSAYARVSQCAHCGLIKEMHFVNYQFALTRWFNADRSVAQYKGKTPVCDRVREPGTLKPLKQYRLPL